MTAGTSDPTAADPGRPLVEQVSAQGGQAVGVNFGQIWQQRFTGPFTLLRDATIPLDPLPGDLRLSDPAHPGNPVARFRGRTDLIAKIDTFIGRYVQQRRGGYLLVEAEAGMGKSALAAYLAFTRGWPAHFTRLPDGQIPERARRNLAAQLIARWHLDDAAPGGILPDGADTTTWLYGRLCDAARSRDSDPDEIDRPVVLLVDGLDEAPPPTPGELPLGLPAALPPGTIIVATTRPSTITLPVGSRVVERIDVESTSNRRDLLDYLTAISAVDPVIADALHQADMTIGQFSQTLLDRSGGVWIYALTVLDQIRDHNRSPTDIDHLPEGLAGYYADEVRRWRTSLSDHNWHAEGLPLLATLTAIQEPQTTATLAAWAGVPEPQTRSMLRSVFRPFLTIRQGGDPDLYLPRHRSLRDFTTGTALADSADEGLRHLGYELAVATHAAHSRITTALTPHEPLGQRHWDLISPYTNAHLPEHAAHAGLLPDLLNDPDFALHVGIGPLLRQRHHLTTPQARAALGALEVAAGHGTTRIERLQWIEVSARKTRAHDLADNAARLLPERTWRPVHANWSGASHQTLTGHSDWARALTTVPLPDGSTLLASASDDGAVRLWDPVNAQPVGQPLTGHTGPVRALSTLPLTDGHTLLASASLDRTVQLWDPTHRAPYGQPLTGHTAWVNALCSVPLPDGRILLASASDDGTVRLWDRNTQPARQPPTQHTGRLNALTPIALPNGHALVASAGDDETVRLWNTSARPAGQPLTGHTGPVHALTAAAFPGGRVLLASAGFDCTVRLWDPTLSAPYGQPLTGHTAWVNALCSVPLPDGRILLASASNDQTVRLWDPTSRQPEGQPLTGHTDGVRALATIALPDGRTLVASASYDGTVRLWDPTSRLPEGQPLTGHTGAVRALATIARPDGRTLIATASDDHAIVLWTTDPISVADPAETTRPV